MLLKILRILVAVDILKHASILHIVAVEDLIASLQIRFAFKIQINGACRTFLPIKIVIQIKIIIRSLHDGIIHICIRDPDPSYGVRIFRSQRLKINRRDIRFL